MILWAPLQAAAGDPASLKIRIVEGDGASYPLGSRSTRGIAVEVTDDTGKPVEEATVNFRLPEDGPGGAFSNKSKTQIATTGRDGRASVWGMQWNRTPGAFEVRITVAKGEARAGTVCSQSLTTASVPAARRSGGSHKWLWAALAVAGERGSRRNPGGTRRKRLVHQWDLQRRDLHRHADHHHWKAAMRILLAIAVPICLWAQSGLNRPRIGEMLDDRGLLWPVFGVGGSFTVDDPRASRVLSTACSRTLCLAKTDSALLSGDIATAAPPGAAAIAIHGTTAWIYFPQTRQFGHWQAGTLGLIDLNVDGDVLSLQAGWKLAVRRGTAVWIVSGDGTILDSLPSETGPVLLIDDGGVVYATSDSLVLRRPGGIETRFAAQGITALLQMGDGYVEARSGSAIYALRTTAGRESLFWLPRKTREVTKWPARF